MTIKYLDDIQITSKKLLQLLIEHESHRMEVRINSSYSLEEVEANGAELICECGKRILID